MPNSSPDPSRSRTVWCALALAAAAGVLYAWTAPRSYGLVDSGELATVCATLGVAHPPGFPLFVMLGHLATCVPLGSVAFRLNLASSLYACVGLVFFYLATVRFLRLLRRVRLGPAGGAETNSVSADTSPSRNFEGSPLLLAALATGLLACSDAYWFWATETEVYALSIALFCALLYVLFRWTTLQQDRADSPRGPGLLFALGLIYGLGLSNHHVSFLLLAPALLYAAVVFRRGLRWRGLALVLCGVGVGLLCYLYLPLRGAEHAELSWGDPSTLRRFWWHITGRQYRGLMTGAGWPIVHANLLGLGRAFWQQTPPWYLPFLALLGLAARRGGGALGLFTIIAVACNACYFVLYKSAGEDLTGYFLPSLVLAQLWVVPGLAVLLRLLPAPGSRSRGAVLAAALLVVAFGPVLALNYTRENRRDYRVAEEFVENVLRDAQSGGLIVTRNWYFYSPSLYHQYVLGKRRDLTIINYDLLGRNWYLRRLQQREPHLVARCAAELAEVERIREAYDSGRLASEGEAAPAFAFFVNRLISFAALKRPVYLTTFPPFDRSVLPGRKLVARGLLFRVVPPGESLEPKAPRIDVTNLLEHGRPYDLAEKRVRRAYVIALCGAASQLRQDGKRREADELLATSLQIDRERTEAILDSLRARGYWPSR